MRLLPALALSILASAPLLAAEPVIAVSTTATTVTYGTWTVVDDQLGVTDSDGGTIDGVRVVINDLVTGDLLRVDPGIDLTALGLTPSYDTGTGVLSIDGNAAAATYQNVLRAVQLNAAATGDANRNISFSLGRAVGFTGSDHTASHYYRFVAGAINWSAAKTAADGDTYFGLQGYLATITTQAENDFIRQKLGGDAWIGASDDVATVNAVTTPDAGVEGDWFWVTGPEAGTRFSHGNITPIVDTFMNWNSSSTEPNNSGGNEHYGEIYNSGSPGFWNDLSGGSVVGGYVIEYGDMAGDPVLHLSGSRSVVLATVVNVLPAFTKGANVTVLEDAGLQVLPAWATGISPGPVSDVTQSVDFVIDSDSNAALFSQLPVVAPDGTLSFRAAADANGVATIVLHLHDDGGTANGGVNVSATQTFTITVTAVNDVPVFTVGARVDVAEDAGAQTINAWATAISSGPADETAQTLTFTVVADHAELFSVQPAISSAGVLTFTPAAQAAGLATISITLSDSAGGVGAVQTAVIAIGEINDAPAFTKGADITVQEDAGLQIMPAWATAISRGPASEAGQTLDFVIDSNSNTALFSQLPAVSPQGALGFVPAANANGVATIVLHIHDDGGTAGGGVNASATQSFTITVTAVNDVPVFTVGSRVDVTEDAGAQTVNAWATAISSGPADEAAQTLTFTVVADHTELFSVQPAISSAGVLTFTPAAQAAGLATISITLSDSAGGVGAVQTAVIAIGEINDAPAFTKGADITVLEDAGLQIMPSWATAISRGPASEAGQTLDFVIDSNSNAALFSQLPAVAPDGTLGFTPAADANGMATITMHLHDSGGTAGGGVDASAIQSFTITVTAVNDRPVFTPGPDLLVAEDAGAQTVAWATDVDAGAANESGQTLTFTVTNSANALFSTQPGLAADGTLTFTPAVDANGTAIVTVTLADDGGGDDHTARVYFTITVSAANDAPTETLPSARTVLEDGVLTLAGSSAIVLGDADAGSSWLMTTLRVDHGTLTLAQLTNLVVVAGTGTADALITVTGPLADLNAALDGMTIHPAADYNGSMTLEVVTDDRGNSGGGNLGITGAVGITVVAVNDAPACVLGAAPSAVADGQARSLSGWLVNASTGPVDEAGQILSFTVSVDHPELFATPPAIAADGTLTFTPGATAGTAVMTVIPVDDGGTANGGQDHGAAQTCTISLAKEEHDDRTWWAKHKSSAYDGRCGVGGGLATLATLLAGMLLLRLRPDRRR